MLKLLFMSKKQTKLRHPYQSALSKLDFVDMMKRICQHLHAYKDKYSCVNVNFNCLQKGYRLIIIISNTKRLQGAARQEFVDVCNKTTKIAAQYLTKPEPKITGHFNDAYNLHHYIYIDSEIEFEKGDLCVWVDPFCPNDTSQWDLVKIVDGTCLTFSYMCEVVIKNSFGSFEVGKMIPIEVAHLKPYAGKPEDFENFISVLKI